MTTLITFEKLLWVLPGLLFVFLYNGSRPVQKIKLSGWPYVFFLVFVAFVTWWPLILYNKNIAEKGFEATLSPTKATLISLLLSYILFLIVTKTPWICKFVNSKTMNDDVFLSSCIELEGEFVVVELKNKMLYAGYLWQYPDDVSESSYEQAISLILHAKGRFDKEKTLVDWFFVYPNMPDQNSIKNREIVISKSEILSLMPDDKVQTAKIWSQIK